MNTIFDQQWQSADFYAQTQALTADFQQAFKLPPVHQLGIVVADVEQAATRLEQAGLGPFFVAAGAPRLWREAGVTRPMSGKLGMAYKDHIEIELLEPGLHTDFYRRSLDPSGRAVIQHLGYRVAQVDDAAQRLVAAGFPLMVRGCLRSLGMQCHFAYLDTRAACGFVTEFIDFRLMGLRVPPAWVYQAMARLQQGLGRRAFQM